MAHTRTYNLLCLQESKPSRQDDAEDKKDGGEYIRLKVIGQVKSIGLG